jgi:DNA-binding GntR family transcriptional regulator
VELSQADKRAKRKRLKLAPRLNTVKQIHDELRRLLLAGAFEPGTQLSQIRLCKTLGVGRTPLREALRMLQQEGLIVAEANKRPRVVSFDPEVIDANSAQVILLFSLATAVSIPKLTDEDLAAMRTSLKEMQEAAVRKDLEAWNEADMKFHGRAFLYVGAPLDRVLKRVWEQNYFYLRFLMSRENIPWSKIHEEHQTILEACTARDTELVPKLIARHIAGGSIALLAHAMPDSEPRMIRAAMRLIVQKPELVALKRAASA